MWRLSDDSAAVLTVDFFTPIVDDPYAVSYTHLCVMPARCTGSPFTMNGLKRGVTSAWTLTEPRLLNTRTRSPFLTPVSYTHLGSHPSL